MANHFTIPRNGGVDSDMSFNRLLSAAKLDYDVVTEPVAANLICSSNRDNYLGTDQYKAVVMYRNGEPQEVLGVNKTRYVPINPRLAFGWIDELVEKYDGEWHSAGRTRNGAWVCAEFPRLHRTVSAIVGDTLVVQLFAWDSYDGSSQTKYVVRLLRLVCENGMMMLQPHSVVTVSHTGNTAYKVGRASQQLDNIGGLLDENEKIVNQLTAVPVTETAAKIGYAALLLDSDFQTARDRVFNSKARDLRNLDILMTRFRWGNGHSADLWGWFNGVTNYLSHEYSTADRRPMAWSHGRGRVLERKSLDIALKMADACDMYGGPSCLAHEQALLDYAHNNQIDA
jgi:hypothetical protein